MYTKVTRVTVGQSEVDKTVEIVLPEPEPWEHNGNVYRPILADTHVIGNELIAVWKIGYVIT